MSSWIFYSQFLPIGYNDRIRLITIIQYIVNSFGGEFNIRCCRHSQIFASVGEVLCTQMLGDCFASDAKKLTSQMRSFMSETQSLDAADLEVLLVRPAFPNSHTPAFEKISFPLHPSHSTVFFVYSFGFALGSPGTPKLAYPSLWKKLVFPCTLLTRQFFLCVLLDLLLVRLALPNLHTPAFEKN